jgi:hypothetical protein
MARRKNTDSRPSRATARNTMPIRATPCPDDPASAASIET